LVTAAKSLGVTPTIHCWGLPETGPFEIGEIKKENGREKDRRMLPTPAHRSLLDPCRADIRGIRHPDHFSKT